MQIRFSLNSPDWQLEWFRNHWRAFWDIEFKNRTTLSQKLDLPVVENREEFSAYLRSLNFNSFLDETQIVCVELAKEEYVAAYYSVNSLD